MQQRKNKKLILGMEGYLVDDEKYPDFMELSISSLSAIILFCL